MLLLRAAVGVAGVLEGSLFFSDRAGSPIENWSVGVALAASGVLLLVGLMTPLASTVAALTTIVAGAWFPPPHTNLFNGPLPIALVSVVAASVAFLGPGSFSLDCRLFGRREIVIPRGGRPPEQ